MQTNKKIILATLSASRVKLLKESGLPWDVAANEFKEELFEGDYHAIHTVEGVCEKVMSLALGKANSIKHKHRNAIIVGCDTLGLIDGEILTKPKGEADATAMYNALENKPHFMITGVALVDTESRKTKTFCEISELIFLSIPKNYRQRQIENGEAFRCSGGYTIESELGQFAKIIQGSKDGVIGLPVALIQKELINFNI